MHELDIGYCNLESPAPDAALPHGRAVLRGWLVPKPAFHFTDVRARIGGRIFRGVYGDPRADLAQFFKLDRAHALAGFTIEVELAPGPNVIALDALENNGRWQPFHNVVCHGSSAPSQLPGRPVIPLRRHEFGTALELWLKTAEPGAAGRECATRIVAETPWPRMLRDAPAPFHGHFDHPPLLAPAHFGQIHLLGWLFHETLAIRRVWASTDLVAMHPLDSGGTFERVHERFPQFPSAREARQFGFASLPAQLPHPISVRIFAELADGSLHLVLALLCRPSPTEELKAAFPRFSLRHCRRAWTELRRACADAAIPLEAGLWREAVAVFRSHRRQAPPSLRHAGRTPTFSADAPKPRRLLLVSHNLNLEGAPLWLLELTRHFIRDDGVRVTLLSPQDGKLRSSFEELGAEVRIVDAAPIYGARDDATIRRTVRALARTIDWSEVDLVVANTIVSFWGVALAHVAGRRALLYVHESTTPTAFFRRGYGAGVLAAVHAAVRDADAVSFIAGPARAYYERLSAGRNFLTTVGWVDIARIDAHRAAHPREAVRTRLGLRPDEVVVANIGAVCDRKGQHVFLNSIELLWRRHPQLAQRCRFLLVGGRDDDHNRHLRAQLSDQPRPNIELVRETGGAFDYFHAADLFVCSSYEEAFPRVVLEAMAFALPIVSTNVHGIPTMVQAEHEAILVAPGDTEAMMIGLVRFAGALPEARKWGARARARVERDFRMEVVLPLHTQLVSGLAASRR